MLTMYVIEKTPLKNKLSETIFCNHMNAGDTGI